MLLVFSSSSPLLSLLTVLLLCTQVYLVVVVDAQGCTSDLLEPYTACVERNSSPCPCQNCDPDPTDGTPVVETPTPKDCFDIENIFCPLVKCCSLCVDEARAFYEACSAKAFSEFHLGYTCSLQCDSFRFRDQCDTTARPTRAPFVAPSASPTSSQQPTLLPSHAPSDMPSTTPTQQASDMPSSLPTATEPTQTPTVTRTAAPTQAPSIVVTTASPLTDRSAATTRFFTDTTTTTTTTTSSLAVMVWMFVWGVGGAFI